MFGTFSDLFQVYFHASQKHQIEKPHLRNKIEVLVITDKAKISQYGTQDYFNRRDRQTYQF